MTDLSEAKKSSNATSLTPLGDIDKRTERIIWRGMTSKSVRQLADETGLAPDAVLRIRNEMLESVDALTIDQRRTKLIVDLQAVSDRAREMAESAQDERALSGLLTSSIQAMKTVLAELARIEKSGKTEVEVLNALRQREIVEMYESVGQPFIEWLAEEYDVPEDVATPKYQELLMNAAREMDERHS